jgi:hypothetical protein
MADSRADELKKPVKAPRPFRVLINGAATAAWYNTQDDEERRKIVEHLLEICRGWIQRPGVRFITSFDDDLFLVGDPRVFHKWTIYIVLEVDELDTVVSMIDDCRQGSLRLHQYFTMNATIGRPFWPIEQAVD